MNRHRQWRYRPWFLRLIIFRHIQFGPNLSSLDCLLKTRASAAYLWLPTFCLGSASLRRCRIYARGRESVCALLLKRQSACRLGPFQVEHGLADLALVSAASALGESLDGFCGAGFFFWANFRLLLRLFVTDLQHILVIFPSASRANILTKGRIRHIAPCAKSAYTSRAQP
ncbi:MAG: hypothetical protein BWY75_03254 [bacterium ADurb.Bin425]|nr:MAG: hypothetical protein BWY75_03254 [bacterium ADurb.Bin425]